MTDENFGHGPTLTVTRFLGSVREAVREHISGYLPGATRKGAAPPRADRYADIERFAALHRGINAPRPLAAFIPSAWGGRGQRVDECLAVLEELSYESLPISLVAGINGALFLQPLSRYGSTALQAAVFPRVVNEGALGGLMITEPDYGSDALQMQTGFVRTDAGYHVIGTKHWAGLTGHADYWLLTARERDSAGTLGRNINFFVWDKSCGGISVDEYFDSLGLEAIPYGRNSINTIIPETSRLEPLASGVRMLLDVLHRSRLQFPGMAMGFLRRLLDEALAHVRSRRVGGRALAEYDQVKDRIAVLEAAYTTCSAMCAYTSAEASIERDCSPLALQANAIKTVITDMMQSAAQSLLQLVGAKGYRRDHIAGRAVVDCRPFQIFEGSNDILYEQIAEAVLKGMKRAGSASVEAYLAVNELTQRAVGLVRGLFDVRIDGAVPQRKLVDLGRALARVISIQMVVDLGARGFGSRLVQNATGVLRREIASLMGSYHDGAQPYAADDYRDAGHWRSFLAT